MSSKTVSTRIMIISDTHGHEFDGTTMPKIDLLIHTGDLTNHGDLHALEESVKMLSTIKAELKLVIAGNHDFTLDSTCRVENMTGEEYSKLHQAALDVMTGPAAKEARITYLDEGTYTIDLTNGARFQIYASPYTPESGCWAFQYDSSTDRFNNVSQTQTKTPYVALNPIPSTIDIVMTHGPPCAILDQVDGQNQGCRSLLHAIGRARPLLHCFGHIHEGHGANIVTWKPDGSVQDPLSATPLETEQVNEYPYANKWDVRRGEQTLMVNSAIMVNVARGMRADHKPFIVVLDLPRR